MVEANVQTFLLKGLQDRTPVYQMPVIKKWNKHDISSYSEKALSPEKWVLPVTCVIRGWLSTKACSVSCCWHRSDLRWPPPEVSQKVGQGQGKWSGDWWDHRDRLKWCLLASQCTVVSPAKWCTRNMSHNWPFCSLEKKEKKMTKINI